MVLGDNNKTCVTTRRIWVMMLPGTHGLRSKMRWICRSLIFYQVVSINLGWPMRQLDKCWQKLYYFVKYMGGCLAAWLRLNAAKNDPFWKRAHEQSQQICSFDSSKAILNAASSYDIKLHEVTALIMLKGMCLWEICGQWPYEIA